jgi:rhodanese-related sulfurtransferase
MRPNGQVRALLTTLLLGGGLAACGGDAQAQAQPESPAVAAPAQAEAVAWKQADPDEFEKLIKADKGMLINVHVPDEGEIAGTDHHIPYDKIVGDKRLPKDKKSQLLIYCRSGRMSTESGQALTDAGYTNVVELRGGFNAWVASGRPLAG